jgi:hypothetical protein
MGLCFSVPPVPRGRIIGQVEEAVRANFVSHGNGPSPVTIEKKNMAVYLFGVTAVVTYIKEYPSHSDVQVLTGFRSRSQSAALVYLFP